MARIEAIQFHTTHKEAIQRPFIQNVFFDADSTLSTIEGIDELAKMKGVQDRVLQMTQDAMNGIIPFEDVYFERLNIIQPSYKDLIKIGHMYHQNITPGTEETIHRLHKRGTRTFIISGGFNPSIQMLADKIGIPREHVFANEFIFDDHGKYVTVNQDIPFPLWTHAGKEKAIQFLKGLYPDESTTMIGDGMGDLKAGKLTDTFVCFAGIAARTTVMESSINVVTRANLAAIFEYI